MPTEACAAIRMVNVSIVIEGAQLMMHAHNQTADWPMHVTCSVQRVGAAASVSTMGAHTSIQKGGVQCADYECISNHPPGRQKKCRSGNRCHTRNCRHWNCKKVHPVGRTQLCPNADHCQDEPCDYLHPPERTEPPKPLIIMSPEVVQLSGGEYNFLELFGSKILDEVRQEPGMNVAKLKDGNLQLQGHSLTVAKMKAYVKQSLREQHVTITSTLRQYLQLACKQPLWKRFVQKHRVGISFFATTNQNPVHSEDDGEDDDEAKSDISTVTTASRHSKHCPNRAHQLLQVISIMQ